MDQLTGEYKKLCLSPPHSPHLSSSMSPALAAGSPLAGGLRSQTCSPGWLASLIKEDRFLASLSLPPSLTSFFFSLGSCWGKWSRSGGGRGRTRKGTGNYRLMPLLPGHRTPRVYMALLPLLAGSLQGMREEETQQRRPTVLGPTAAFTAPPGTFPHG